MPFLNYPEEMSVYLLTHVFQQTDWIGYLSGVARNARATALLIEAGEFLRTEDKDLGRAVVGLLDRLLRTAPDTPTAALTPRKVELFTALERHARSLLAQPDRAAEAAWEGTAVSKASRSVPTMLTDETMQFYKWLGGQVSPEAHIVELGAWLGSSTRCLCEGLRRDAMMRQSIDVYDSFVWAPWMDRHVSRAPGDRWPSSGESFLGLFNDAVREYERHIATHPSWIGDGIADGSRPDWTCRAPIELLIYDMGPDRPVLDAIWESFSPFFQPNITVLVFNEFGKVHSTALWGFCESHSDCLQPHYKPLGSPKAFLYV
jgi:hypothetical protein